MREAEALPAPANSARAHSIRSNRSLIVDIRCCRCSTSQRCPALGVAGPQLAAGVALLGDVATHQRTGLDVHRHVVEELAEDVGVAGRLAEAEALELLAIVQVSALGEGDAVGATSDPPRLDRVAQLVDPLGEGHRVLALAQGDHLQHAADVVVRRGAGPRLEQLLAAALADGDRIQQTQV